MKFRAFLAATVGAVFLCMAASARADDVKTDYNHQIDFANFHTYCWEKVDGAGQMAANRVQHGIDIQLQSKGWQQNAHNCQVSIYVKGNVKNQHELETYYDGLGGGWGGRWGWGGWGWGSGGGFGMATTAVKNAPEAFLVVDMFDNRSKQLVWRGVTQREISNSADKDRRAIREDIDKMFKNFPPKK